MMSDTITDNVTSQETSSSSLFNKVGSNDFEGIIRVYASMGYNSLVSYDLRNRWGVVRRMSSLSGGEEKLDESFQYRNSNDSSSCSPMATSYYSQTTQALQDIIAGRDPDPTFVTALNNIAYTDYEEQFEPSFPRCMPKKCKKVTSADYPLSIPNLAQSPPISPNHCETVPDVCQSNKQGKIAASSPCTEFDIKKIERILQESAKIISNSRPESNFVVYPKARKTKSKQSMIINEDNDDSKMSLSSEDNDTIMHDPSDNEEGIEENGVEEENGVGDISPLFDGTVANATPVGDLSMDANTVGGHGTILHLACALDSPFALAILLIMDADASSRHTAFRRLMVHEAACSNSPECLTLLLELGKAFCEDVEKMPRTKETGEGCSSKLSTSSYGNFFFSPWNNKKKCVTETTSNDHNMAVRRKSPRNVDNERLKSKFGGLPFVSTLLILLKFVKDMNTGKISEFDAARKLLWKLSLSDTNKSAIIASCFAKCCKENAPGAWSVNISADYPVTRMQRANVTRQNTNADGHGNTPLHWASFKNATACVSVLLSHNADPNARAEPSGWTPLHDAAYSDASESVSLLVSAGADINAQANSGATPLCFAAQEDAPKATKLLLDAGADALVRCCGHGHGGNHSNVISQNNPSRFSGYTPLHYCAHYNAHRAARVLLEYNRHHSAKGPGSFTRSLLEIPDLSEKLPIHVAVARGSSDVLRELLHGGARVDTTGTEMISCGGENGLAATSQTIGSNSSQFLPDSGRRTPSPTPTNLTDLTSEFQDGALLLTPTQTSPAVITPVSSPVLRSMLPARPVSSSKPWNCLSQRSIDECKQLLREAELNWTPKRHSLFHPRDRLAVVELLRVGKRLEQMGTSIFIELWPLVLSFCGRGWFEPDNCQGQTAKGRKIGDTNVIIIAPTSQNLIGQAPDTSEMEDVTSFNRDMEFNDFCL